MIIDKGAPQAIRARFAIPGLRLRKSSESTPRLRRQQQSGSRVARHLLGNEDSEKIEGATLGRNDEYLSAVAALDIHEMPSNLPLPRGSISSMPRSHARHNFVSASIAWEGPRSACRHAASMRARLNMGRHL